MARTNRDFTKRPKQEQAWLLAETWCDSCNKPDLGLKDPIEFEENGKIYIEGKCVKCNAKVVSELTEKQSD